MPWYHDLAVVWKGDVASAVLQVVSTYEGGVECSGRLESLGWVVLTGFSGELLYSLRVGSW